MARRPIASRILSWASFCNSSRVMATPWHSPWYPARHHNFDRYLRYTRLLKGVALHHSCGIGRARLLPSRRTAVFSAGWRLGRSLSLPILHNLGGEPKEFTSRVAVAPRPLDSRQQRLSRQPFRLQAPQHLHLSLTAEVFT